MSFCHLCGFDHTSAACPKVMAPEITFGLKREPPELPVAEIVALTERCLKAEAERDMLKKILAESCDDNRQDYFSTYDCASPCPIGFKVQELEVERDRLREALILSEQRCRNYEDILKAAEVKL